MKNRYCRRTKLNEADFILIVVAFCQGKTASATALEFEKASLKIARQTIERKFLELGNYIWKRFTLSQLLQEARHAHPERQFTDERFEEEWLEDLWAFMHGKTDYKEYRSNNWDYPTDENIMRVLRERWTLFNGFGKQQLSSHVGYASFMGEAQSILDVSKIVVWLLERLENDPL